MTIMRLGLVGVRRKAFPGSFLVFTFATLLAVLTWRSASAEGALDRQVTLNIADNTRLEDALIQVGTAAGVTIMINTPTIDRQTIREYHATVSVRDALSALLRGSGLWYSEEGGRVRVVPAASFTPTSDREPTVAANGTGVRSPAIHVATAGNDDGSPFADLSEVVVTAQKREEKLVDVPISIAVLSTQELAEREVINLEDMASAVPGMAVQSSGSQRRVELRGVSNFAGSNSALIGMYLDEADVTSQAALQLNLNTYDLARVEVLRGPQGTLYGEGSAGGTIRLITRDPVLNGFAADSDVTAMFTQDGAPGQRVQAVVNVPLVEGQLGVRIAGLYDHQGGWIDEPAAGQKDFNGGDLADVRFKALWKPSSALSVNLMANIHRNNDGSSAHGEDDNGNYTQAFNLATVPKVRDNYDIYNATISYDLEFAQLLSTSTYLKQDRETSQYGYSLPLLPPGTGPVFDVYLDPYTDTVRAYTQELRLASADSGPWQWTVGGFYRHFRFEEVQNYYFGLAGPLPTTAFTGDNDNLSKAYAVFGDTSYKVTRQLTVGTGLRYYSDDQEYTSSNTSQAGKFHSVNPRGYLQYKLDDWTNLYASASKGFRSGGFNSVGQPTFGPESVWTYELGTKVAQPGGAVSADLAVFYSNYSNYQVVGIPPLPAPAVPISSNGGSARIKGVEADVTWRPLEGWSLSASGNYIDSYFYRINVTSADHNVGDPLDFVPKYSFALSAQRDYEFDGKSGFVRLDYNQQGRQTFRLRSVGPWFNSESDVINMLNLNVSLNWTDNLRFGIFAQNLLNDRGFVDPFRIEGTASRSRPRSVGIELGMKL